MNQGKIRHKTGKSCHLCEPLLRKVPRDYDKMRLLHFFIYELLPYAKLDRQQHGLALQIGTCDRRLLCQGVILGQRYL